MISVLRFLEFTSPYSCSTCKLPQYGAAVLLGSMLGRPLAVYGWASVQGPSISCSLLCLEEYYMPCVSCPSVNSKICTRGRCWHTDIGGTWGAVLWGGRLPPAINYLDCSLPASLLWSQSQITGTVCLLLSSKLLKTTYLHRPSSISLSVVGCQVQVSGKEAQVGASYCDSIWFPGPICKLTLSSGWQGLV